MTKKIFFISALLLIGIGVFVFLNFGDLAKSAAEKIASDALGVKVRIASLTISLADKEVNVNGVRISNPPGYKKAHAITTNKIIIGLNTASKELIDFNDIKIEGTVVNLEVTEKGTNLTDLKKLAAQKPQKQSVGSEQVHVIVRNMVIGTSTLNPSVTLLGTDVASIKIPPVRVSNIGKLGQGVLAKDAITQIMTKYIKTAERQAGTAGMLGGLEDAAKDIGDAVDDLKTDFKKLFD